MPFWDNLSLQRTLGVLESRATTVYGNTVFGSYIGIYASPNLQDSTQSLIQENLVFNNTHGIELLLFGNYNPLTMIAQNNTISNNANGIFIGSYSGAVSYLISGNNIYNNSNYNFLMAGGVSSNIDATYNWWGTNDSQAIGPTIYDFKNNFNLGTVNYTPFLNSSNPLAPVYNPSAPSPSPGPSPTPTSSPTPSPASSPTPSPTLTPSVSPTLSPTPTITPTPTPTPTPILTSPTPTAKLTPTPIPTLTLSQTPQPSPIQTPLPLPPTTLTISCVSSTSYSSFKVDINGNLAANETWIKH